MGCCTSSAAAGGGAAKPDVIARDMQDIVFTLRPIRRAVYGPEDGTGANEPRDVTVDVRAIIADGHLEIRGGAHTAFGDHFAGQAKVFKLWYMPPVPDAEWDDFEEITLKGVVAFATYGPEDAPAGKDVTAAIQKLQAEGKTTLVGGVHVALSEPMPCENNKFKVWY